jgi:transposase
MRPYSADLRERVLGAGTRAVAARYAVREAWDRRLKQRRRETGSAGPRAANPGPKPVLGPHAGRLRELVRRALCGPKPPVCQLRPGKKQYSANVSP